MLRPLAEIRCLAVDVVLVGAFDWRELSNLLRQADIEVPDCCPAGRARVVTRIAHTHTHRDCSFSRLLEKQLDFRFASVMRAVEEWDSMHLVRTLTARGLEPEEIPGTVWALARDPRPEMQTLLDDLLHQIQHSALRGLLGTGSVACGA